MQKEIIGKSTVKVTLSAEELELFGLGYETIDGDDPRTRGMILYILGEISETGTSAAEENLYIEIFPRTDGGCLMYISPVDTRPHKKNISSAKKHRRKSIKSRLPELVFSCTTAEELIVCADILKKYAGRSMEYSSLFCSEDDFRIIAAVSIPASLGEFPQSIASAYTREHYRLLIEGNAVEMISGIIP